MTTTSEEFFIDPLTIVKRKFLLILTKEYIYVDLIIKKV